MSLIFLCLWRIHEVLLSNPTCRNIKSILNYRKWKQSLQSFCLWHDFNFDKKSATSKSITNDLKMRSVIFHLLNFTVWVNLQYLSRRVPDRTDCCDVKWDSLDFVLCTFQGKNCSSFALILNSSMLCNFSIKFELRLSYIKRTKWKKRIPCSLIHFKKQLYI